MSYSSGGLIQALDYNTFVQGGASVNHSIANINSVWGVGSGDKGYGQSSNLSTVAGGNDVVTATQWSTLISRLNSILSHQSGSGSKISAPTAGATVQYLSAMSGKITDAYNNRLNAASNGTDVANQGSSTYNYTSSSTASFTRTVTFGSADQARYFFNAGGKIIINFTATNNAGNTKGNDWVSLIQTKMASVTVGAATNSRGGTGGGSQLAATGYGYWNAGTTNRDIVGVTSSSGTADYGSNSFTVGIRTNGVQGSNGDVGTQLIFTMSMNDTAADSSFNDEVNVIITSKFTIRPPETANLTSTWGTPTFS